MQIGSGAVIRFFSISRGTSEVGRGTSEVGGGTSEAQR